jgi:predicted SAM-dependent methyltransferase
MELSSQEPSARLSPAHPDGIRRVQVGCGPHHLRRDWWNTDLRHFPNIDEAIDATQPWPWAGRLDFVYGEHFLEHLEIDQGLSFLKEAGRALRIGGRIRLSTPSLEWVLKTHFTFQPSDSPQHFEEALILNRGFYGWGHKFLYSRGVLDRLLREVGYEDIRFYRFGESDIPAFTGLELHPNCADACPYPSQWIVEGQRGQTNFQIPDALIAALDEKLLSHVRPGH